MPGLLFAAALLVVAIIGDLWLMSIAIVGIGLGGIWVGIRSGPEKFKRGMRYMRGPGWWLGWLISKLPFRLARALWLALSAGITAFGVWGVTRF